MPFSLAAASSSPYIHCMPKLAIAFLLLLISLAAHAQKWQLAWSDEFDGPAHSAPSTANWSYETGASGWGNAEIETYCAASSNIAPCSAAHPNTYLDGEGHLVIRAIRTPSGWTSGRMITKGRHEFQYGRIEARIKLPTAAGFWPAFWMLGSNIDSVHWPQSGEQDIMEWVQKYTPTTTSSTIHGPGYSGGKSITKEFAFPAGGRVDNAFHVYGVLWSKDKLQFYRDDPAAPFFTMTPADLPSGTEWVFNHPFFLLLNFAIGSSGFAGATSPTTPEIGTVLVDYVRVYKAAEP